MQRIADKDIPPPTRPQLRGIILSLKRGESWLFTSSPAASVRSTVSQINGETVRQYTTKVEDRGTRVWRLK